MMVVDIVKTLGEQAELDTRLAADAELEDLRAVADVARLVRTLAIRYIDPLDGLIYKVEPGDMAVLADALDELDGGKAGG